MGTHGRLTRLTGPEYPDQGVKRWFRCDCGTEKLINRHNVTYGKSNSCGCYMRDRIAATSRKAGYGTRERTIWRGMLGRCHIKSNSSYLRYGGRGISVCPRWESFEDFLADMGPCPDGMTIERKDGNGNYEPGNCVWATSKEQANNRRSSRRITIGERTQTLSQWADEYGADYARTHQRIRKGWAPLDALTREVRPY